MPLPEGWDEEKLESTLFGAAQPRPTDPDKAAPDFAAIHEQKQRHRHVTLQLLWDVERWVIAALRHHRFCSLAEVNHEIRRLLEKLNARPFRKREGSRSSLFTAIDRPALRPLPLERFDLSQWSRARVNIDYHIAFDTNFYSVPYNLVHELVEVRATPTTVEILLVDCPPGAPFCKTESKQGIYGPIS